MDKNLIKYAICFVFFCVVVNILNQVKMIPCSNDLPNYIKVASAAFIGFLLSAGSVYIADKISEFITKE